MQANQQFWTSTHWIKRDIMYNWLFFYILQGRCSQPSNKCQHSPPTPSHSQFVHGKMHKLTTEWKLTLILHSLSFLKCLKRPQRQRLYWPNQSASVLRTVHLIIIIRLHSIEIDDFHIAKQIEAITLNFLL